MRASLCSSALSIKIDVSDDAADAAEFVVNLKKFFGLLREVKSKTIMVAVAES